MSTHNFNTHNFNIFCGGFHDARRSFAISMEASFPLEIFRAIYIKMKEKKNPGPYKTEILILRENKSNVLLIKQEGRHDDAHSSP